jgi:hypothetical protein
VTAGVPAVSRRVAEGEPSSEHCGEPGRIFEKTCNQPSISGDGSGVDAAECGAAKPKKPNMKLLILSTVSLLSAGCVQVSDFYTPRRSGYCAPVYRYTRQVGCRTEYRWGTDHCGRRVAYPVRVVTYADYYSNGSVRTYTRSGAL